MNKIFTYKINKIEINHGVVLLNITPKRGEVFDFKSGQFVMLAIYNEKGNVWQHILIQKVFQRIILKWRDLNNVRIISITLLNFLDFYNRNAKYRVLRFYYKS